MNGLSKKQIAQAVARFTKNWKDPRAIVTIQELMKTIETDMLGYSSINSAAQKTADTVICIKAP